VWQLLGIVFHIKHLLINKDNINISNNKASTVYITLPRLGSSHKQCTLAMFGSIPPERLLASAIQTSKIYNDNNFSVMLNGVTDRRELSIS